MRQPVHPGRMEPLREFLRAETAGGIVLLAAVLIAMVWANGPWADGYQRLWESRLTVPLVGTMDLRHWVNESLMVVFFFLVGLEVKRELVTGELSGVRKAALPAVAAAGGVVLPAVIFLAIVGGGPDARGWGIPIATDIAFAAGVLVALGGRVCGGIRLFLISVAIVDDVIAILVIALFYPTGITWMWLIAAVAGILMVVTLRSLGVKAIWPYVPVGLVLWLAIYRFGVHPTIAGVALALLTPARPFGGRDVLSELEHWLHPVSAFLVIPIFALANAGVDLRGGVLTDAVHSPLAWAVAIGLIAGKTIGVGATTALAVRTGLGRLPAGMRVTDVWRVAPLAGIGFTVSLFIADLAFGSGPLIDQAKVGVFAGSLASALIGLLALALRRETVDER